VRYAVLADVHGNAHALEAVLDAARGLDVDRYLCAGDLVGYGPFPDRCVARLAALPAVCVAGNHDLIALDRLGDGSCIPAARTSLAWTRSVMSAATRAMLAALPPDAELENGAIIITHGALGDPQRYLRTAADAAAHLAELDGRRPHARVIVVGHTHRAMAVDAAGRMLLFDASGTVELPQFGRVLLNPGAVGQSRERRVRARFMVLDLDRREAAFHAVDYDVEAARSALATRGLPAEGVQLHRPWWRRAGARVKGARSTSR
jgi:predicted phosphodiesterase